MTPCNSGSQKTRRLSPEQEAFASWFVTWWKRRGQQIDFSAKAALADHEKLPAANEIEIWREGPEPTRRPDGTRDQRP